MTDPWIHVSVDPWIHGIHGSMKSMSSQIPWISCSTPSLSPWAQDDDNADDNSAATAIDHGDDNDNDDFKMKDLYVGIETTLAILWLFEVFHVD